MMTLQLGRWSQHQALRRFRIERAAIHTCKSMRPVKRTRRFSLGNLKILWASSA
ncbi:hypothetical protein RKLH11_551 [Rhodobacteraceae bacterium KLH11]|nr:hypothetical protein RKLH11_551 [Rhodobacteraceae bacterium KLH11]